MLPLFPVLPLPAAPSTIGLAVAAPVSPPTAVDVADVSPVSPDVAVPVASEEADPESPPVATPVAPDGGRVVPPAAVAEMDDGSPVRLAATLASPRARPNRIATESCGQSIG